MRKPLQVNLEYNISVPVELELPKEYTYKNVVNVYNKWDEIEVTLDDGKVFRYIDRFDPSGYHDFKRPDSISWEESVLPFGIPYEKEIK